MKNKLFINILMIFLVVTIGGCGETKATEEPVVTVEEIEIVQTEDSSEDVKTDIEREASVENTESAVEENTSVEAEVSDAKENLTFADLSKLQFEFSSGAGGWSEEFTIEKDGYFTGLYHDSDMGSVGEGYDYGTVYSSSYSGHFTDIRKINDYTYEMKLADITYKDVAGEEEIIDNTCFVYTKSYCLGGTDTFKIYLPGTPLNELSEDVLIWLYSYNDSEEELTITAIVDEANGYGIYSFDRLEPLEDAKMTLDSYKESYEYYNDKLSEAITTLDMAECTDRMYKISDDSLNEIWNLVRYNVDEAAFTAILEEQRAWIAEKETKSKEIIAGYEGGSLAPVDNNITLASFTMERCEELIEYLE